MRWKLLVLVSTIASLVAFGLWFMSVDFFFGSDRPVQRGTLFLLATLIIPIAVAVFAGIFLYRRTSRRRKTQAVMTVLLTLLLAAGIHFAGERLFPAWLDIARPCHRPPCI
jgi:amino acid transporter